MALDPLSAGLSVAGKIVDIVGRYISDPAKAAEAALEIERLAADERTQQVEVNKLEATSSSTFVAGWRPLIGWLCGLTVGWNFVVAPMATWTLQVAGISTPPLPVLDGTMAQLLFGILGLNVGARTIEKVQGVASHAVRR